MPAPWRDDCEDDLEAPQEADLRDPDDDETTTLPCPHCGGEVAELADRCPNCGDWIVQGQPRRRRPGLLLVVIGLLILVVVLFWR